VRFVHVSRPVTDAFNLTGSYPDKAQKAMLMQQSGLSAEQLRNWLNNMRKRHWFPIKKGLRAPRTHEEFVLLQAQKRSRAASAAAAVQVDDYNGDAEFEAKRPRRFER